MKRCMSTKCSKRIYPLCDSYNTLRHIHFPGTTPFSKGQDIQNTIVNANLDFKNIESKMRKRKLELDSQGLPMSSYEKDLLQKILNMRPLPMLLTFEFENVYTGGKKIKKQSHEENIRKAQALNCKFFQLERGGEVTWHGQGQLVAYLVLDLKQFHDLSLRCFVDAIQLQGVRNILGNKYGLETFENKNPGVWMTQGDDKIASVGCNIQRSITSYGIALNVSPDLRYLNTYTMCGLPTKATSIAALVPGSNFTVRDAALEYAKEITQLLGIANLEHVFSDDNAFTSYFEH